MKPYYSKPFVSAGDIKQAVEISTPKANTLILDFEQLGILKEITGQQRRRTYNFERYLNLFLS